MRHLGIELGADGEFSSVLEDQLKNESSQMDDESLSEQVKGPALIAEV